MAFNIGSAISGAISGAASGFMMGGPYGAAAGGVLGGAAGGFGIGGGPSSIGGITGSGGQSGREAREYYDEAFPGTNPWERLGAGNPMGALGAAAISAKTQERNVDAQIRGQVGINAVNAATSVKVAKINQASAGNVATIHSGPAGVQAAAQLQQAGTAVRATDYKGRHVALEEKRMTYQREHSDAQVSKMFENVTSATAAGIKLKAFRLGSRGRMGEDFLYKHRKAIFALGVGKEELSAFAAAAGIVGGGAAVSRILRGVKSFPKKTSVRVKK